MKLSAVRTLHSLKTKSGRVIKVGQEVDINYHNNCYGVIDRISIYPQIDGSEEIKVRVIFNADGLGDEGTVIKNFNVTDLGEWL